MLRLVATSIVQKCPNIDEITRVNSVKKCEHDDYDPSPIKYMPSFLRSLTYLCVQVPSNGMNLIISCNHIETSFGPYVAADAKLSVMGRVKY